MRKKLAVFISSLILLMNLCGCAALIVGSVAGGAGTAVWLSGKLVQYVNSPLEQVNKAAKGYLELNKLSLTTREVITSEHSVIQIRSRAASGERVLIDIHKITETRSRIEVRVGTLISNKQEADKILKGITSHL